MKRTITAIALALPCLAFAAGGTADGIYTCSVSALGRTAAAVITVNGQIDGRAVFAVVAMSPTQDFFGYGIGSISGPAFAGSTSHGGAFNLTVSPTGMSGIVGVNLSGTFVNAQTTCTKIF